LRAGLGDPNAAILLQQINALLRCNMVRIQT
jgi:hypothetical protein